MSFPWTPYIFCTAPAEKGQQRTKKSGDASSKVQLALGEALPLHTVIQGRLTPLDSPPGATYDHIEF
jgi:hypothetical protein